VEWREAWTKSREFTCVSLSHLDDFDSNSDTFHTKPSLKHQLPLHLTVTGAANHQVRVNSTTSPYKATHDATSTMADIDMDVDMDIDLGLDPEIAQLEAEAMKIVRPPVAIATNTR
jgi:hypothetical protein